MRTQQKAEDHKETADIMEDLTKRNQIEAEES